jgi:hypothetical protein
VKVQFTDEFDHRAAQGKALGDVLPHKLGVLADEVSLALLTPR